MILRMVLLVFIGIAGFPQMGAANDTIFKGPERVYIDGLPVGSRQLPISTEEPFLSREGDLLFFNSGHKEGKKDLHYARLVKGCWNYEGEVGPGVNSPKDVQATASLDAHGNFFYVDTRAPAMLRQARFDPETRKISGIEDFMAIPKRRTEFFRARIHGNMDIEVTADGSFVVVSRGTWGWNGYQVRYIQAADLLISKRDGETFVYNREESQRLLKNINTGDLEYAAALSADGCELFFTRLAADDLANVRLRSRIMRATRRSVNDPFEPPEMIEAIGFNNFVEAPALSSDEKTLYYHQKVGKKFRLFKVSRSSKWIPQ